MIGLIWAQSTDGYIGRDGTMPWHLPEDFARFRELTTGHPVVMGRTTWESLPPRSRPLPGRRNLVLSRRPGLRLDGAEVVAGPAEALALVGDVDVWVIGGTQVYEAFLDVADRLEVTDVDLQVRGDTRAPAVDERWRRVAADPADGWHESSTGVRYRYRTLVRR